MGGVFFISWQLWEEMTFVLACAIVVVFLLGLFKLWRTNRILRRQERIDEEKRARLGEMRRVGLPPHKKRINDIPFGIRALQSGVEVEGIWISRPAKPSSNSNKDKHVPLEDTLAPPKSAANTFEPPNVSAPLPQISENTTFLSNSRNVPVRVGLLNEEALRHLESYSSSPTATRVSHMTTYVPSSSISSRNAGSSRRQSHQYQHLQQNASTSGHYRPSKHIRSASAESEYMDCNSSIGSSRSSSLRQDTGEGSAAPDASTSATTKGPSHGHSNPPSSPVRLPKGPYGQHPALRTEPLAGDAAMARPTTTFGPGDSFANRASRRINSGFEVLPAGTFGGPSRNSQHKSGNSNAIDKADEPTDPRITTIQPARNKLRKTGPA